MTRRPILAAFAVAAALFCVTPAAWALGGISGTITDVGAAGIAGIEVRAWRLQAGGTDYVIQTMTLTDGAGAYSLTVPADSYKVDARMPPLFSGNYGDRWYDVTSPTSGGYVQEDADVIGVPDLVTVPGVNIVLEVLGGLDGRVATGAGSGVAGLWVRAERFSDPRIHHNDQTKMPAGVTGDYSFRGLVPGSDYEIITYDPGGVYDTGLFPGPFIVIASINGAVGDLTATPYASDPYEPNAGPVCGSPDVDYSGFTMSPPLPWSSSGAWIGPLGADVDWLCVSAMQGDRFLATVSTEFLFSGVTRYHPWTDPILSFWTGDGATMIVEDDDSGVGPLDAYVDTGPMPSAGCYCFVISTFGDTGDGLWNGAGQGSTGDFVLTVNMGNRAPQLAVTQMGVPVPTPPSAIFIDEGATLALDFTYGDQDGDPVLVDYTHTDNAGAAVTGGAFTSGGGTGSYTWLIGPVAATGSPYTITITAEDAEFTTAVPITVIVNSVNNAPSVPTLVAPPDGGTVSTATPTLTLGNSTDAEGDPITYDIELYYDAATAPLAQSQTIGAMPGPTTSTTATSIPENTLVFWRARASDGLVGGTSAWTPFGTFRVDVANDPPLATVLIKPFEGEVVLVRRPGVSASNTTDPEGSALNFFFEVATDASFATVVASSPGVPQDDLSTTTVWTVDVDLDWGGSYFARAWVEDAAGAASAISNVNSFSVKENVQPSRPDVDPAETCQDARFDTGPPASFAVANVEDPEGEAVTLELEIHLFGDDPDMTPPLVIASVPQDESATSTVVPVDASALGPGHYAWRVRAFDGTDYSDWLSCDFWIGDPGAAGGDGDEPGGCGCGCRVGVNAGAATADGTIAGLLAFALALALLRVRPRRS